MQRIAYSSTFIPSKNQREFFTSGEVFAVKGANVSWDIRTFCGCKPSKKTKVSLIKILLVLIKKCGGSGLTPRYTDYQKVERKINYGENYRINTRLNLKTTVGLFER